MIDQTYRGKAHSDDGEVTVANQDFDEEGIQHVLLDVRCWHYFDSVIREELLPCREVRTRACFNASRLR